MNSDVLIDLINNAALLLALNVLYELLLYRPIARFNSKKVLSGIFLGLIGIAVMLNPLQFAPGVMFDTRSILLSLAGLSFGLIPTGVAAAMTSLLRLYQGGIGAWTGVAVILISGGIGIFWRHFRRNRPDALGWPELYVFGLVVHAAMMLCMLTLPWPIAVAVLRSVALPVMIVYPAATVLLALLLMSQTDRRQTEQMLQENKDRFALVQRVARVGVWEWNIEHDTVFWSEEIEKIFGLEPGQFSGTFTEVIEQVHPDDLERWQASVQASLDDRQEHNLEFRIVWPDGTLRWVSALGNVVERDEQGDPVCMLGLVMDITERKQAEQALKESEKKYRWLFETMAQGVVYQDKQGQIIAANPAAERILGLTLDQMQGRTSLDPRWRAIHEDGSSFPGDTHPAIIALKTGQKVQNVVMGVYHPKKEEYTWININATPFFRPDQSKPYQVYTTFEDITERIRAEKALQQLNADLEQRVTKRTRELQRVVNLMADRELRMVELKTVIGQLRQQIQSANGEPVANDPLDEPPG